MQTNSIAICSDLLATWLSKSSSPDVAHQLAKSIGYNDSPFFGAQKKRLRIVGELVIAKSAIAIVAVNEVFGPEYAKPIIDGFLATARKSIFSFLEAKDQTFKERYELHIAEYFSRFSENQPYLSVSSLFMQYLDLDPIRHGEGQLKVMALFTQSLRKSVVALDVVKRTFEQAPQDSRRSS